MNSMHYVGLDVHKKTISYCVRQSDGTILQENTIAATRPAMDAWMRQLSQPWTAGMEARCSPGGFTITWEEVERR
jgi:transposase